MKDIVNGRKQCVTKMFNYDLSENVHKRNVCQKKFLLTPHSSFIRYLNDYY